MYTKTKLRSKQNPNKFEQIYAELENIYNMNFAEIEKKVNSRLWLLTITIMVATFLLILTFIQSAVVPNTLNLKLAIPAVILIFSSPLFFINQSPEEKNFVKNFEKAILDSLVKKFGKSLTFNPETADRSDVLDSYKSNGYEVSPLSIYSRINDVIEGTLPDGRPVRISDVSFRKSGGKSSITLFEGLFLETTIDKSINTNMHVAFQNMEFLNIDRSTKIEFENSKFEKLFNVYAENKITAAQILTSDVLEKLYHLSIDYGMNYDFVIKGNKLSIRFDVGFIFNTIERRNKLHKEDLLVCYSVLNYTFLILNEINNIINNTAI